MPAGVRWLALVECPHRCVRETAGGRTVYVTDIVSGPRSGDQIIPEFVDLLGRDIGAENFPYTEIRQPVLQFVGQCVERATHAHCDRCQALGIGGGIETTDLSEGKAAGQTTTQ